MARLDYAATTKTASREGLLLKVAIGRGACSPGSRSGGLPPAEASAELAAGSGFGEPAPKPKPSHLGEISDSPPNELLPISQSFPAYLAIDSAEGPSASPRMAELLPFEKKAVHFRACQQGKVALIPTE
jgi:hypothetical protein